MTDNRIQAVATEIWGDLLDRETKKAEAAKAKADKDTPVFAVPLRYSYYGLRMPRQPGLSYRFAYTKTKNVAGFYLSFTIRVSDGIERRTGWIGWKTKREAMEHCRTRYFDAKKPKADRRYILP